jgi:nucleobase:cation symporter-1, NCS1 family
MTVDRFAQSHSMQTPESTPPVPTEIPSEVLKLEGHGVDYIPLSERHGRPRDLFTLWFSANAMAITLATGAIAGTTGLGLAWASLAIVVGALVGTVFMAYHSAQGPQLGLPQMIQSRAQFGFFGANVPMVIVIAMYLGFYAGGAILGAQALSLMLGTRIGVGVAILTGLSLMLASFGYNLMHWIGRAIAPVYIGVFALLSFALVRHWESFPTVASIASTHFQLTPFFMVVSVIAAYYISYGPYVADYSRYLPADVSTNRVFACTYAGVIASAVWIMVLGAAIQTAFGQDDAVAGTASVASTLGGLFRWITLLTLVIGLANINAFNIYGAMMSSLTIVTSITRRATVSRLQRMRFLVGLATAGGFIAGMASSDFLHAYENFIFFIVTFLIPWSAINLVDYYWIRNGHYVAADLFTADGQYGRYNWHGLTAYALGCLCQVPFISQEFYTGSIAARLGFDVAWVVGLIVPGAVFLTFKRARNTRTGLSVEGKVR